MIEMNLNIGEDDCPDVYLEFIIKENNWPYLWTRVNTPKGTDYSFLMNSIEAEEVMQFFTIYLDRIKKEEKEESEFQGCFEKELKC